MWIIKSLFEAAGVAAVLWGLFNEDIILDFEAKAAKKIKRLLKRRRGNA